MPRGCKRAVASWFAVGLNCLTTISFATHKGTDLAFWPSLAPAFDGTKFFGEEIATGSFLPMMDCRVANNPPNYRSRRRASSKNQALAIWALLIVIVLGLTTTFFLCTPGFKNINGHITSTRVDGPSNPATSSKESWYPELRYPASSIRILYIRPGKSRDKLRGQLEVAPLAQRPEYDALTYSWGDPSDSKTIVINGKKTRITKNLHEALVNIRDRSKTIPIWVDQICIDQTNLSEKSSQIPLMTDIYSRARTVRMWLGNIQGPRWAEEADKLDWTGDWATSHADRYPRAARYWLYRLADAEYWKRTWIIQEVGVASQIEVHFGSKQSMPWRVFIKLMEWYRQGDHDANVRSIYELDALRETMSVDRSHLRLSNLLTAFYDSFSTIPLDKVYAFLGIASEYLNGCIDVDYTKSIYEVYRDVMTGFNNLSDPSFENQIGMVHFASVVRQSLQRKSLRVPKTQKYFGKEADPTSYLYHQCGDEKAVYCSTEMDPSGNITTDAVFSDYLADGWRWISSLGSKKSAQHTNVWLPSESEPLEVWLSNAATFESDITTDVIQIRGLVSSTVAHIGPSLSSLNDDVNIARRWAGEVEFHQSPKDRGIARGMNDRCMSLLGVSPQSWLNHVAPLGSTSSGQTSDPKLFLGSPLMVGLIPSVAERGDLIVQFWNSNSALVVRRGQDGSLNPIGRALVVRAGGFEWNIPKSKEMFREGSPNAVDLWVSLANLTALSLDSMKLGED